jgi:hypothetical protein
MVGWLVSNELMKWPWYYPRICLMRPRKTTRILYRGSWSPCITRIPSSVTIWLDFQWKRLGMGGAVPPLSIVIRWSTGSTLLLSQIVTTRLSLAVISRLRRLGPVAHESCDIHASHITIILPSWCDVIVFRPRLAIGQGRRHHQQRLVPAAWDGMK